MRETCPPHGCSLQSQRDILPDPNAGRSEIHCLRKVAIMISSTQWPLIQHARCITPSTSSPAFLYAFIARSLVLNTRSQRRSRFRSSKTNRIASLMESVPSPLPLRSSLPRRMMSWAVRCAVNVDRPRSLHSDASGESPCGCRGGRRTPSSYPRHAPLERLGSLKRRRITWFDDSACDQVPTRRHRPPR
jgi:hypothetical protein